MEDKKLFDFDFDALGDKVKNLMNKAGEVASESKEKIQGSIDDLKSQINAEQTNLEMKANEFKGQAFSELLQAKMNLDVQSQKLKEQIEIKSKDIAEGTKGAKAKAAAKYADIMAEFADIISKEAAKAKLEAELALKEEAEDEEKEE